MRLFHKGIVMNPKKIRRLMQKYNLFCPIRKANPYRRMAKALKTNHIAENLVDRQFKAHGPRSVLLTDITYIPYNGTFCYLSTVIDAYTKQVLSYVLSESLEVDFVLRTTYGTWYRSISAYISLIRQSSLQFIRKLIVGTASFRKRATSSRVSPCSCISPRSLL